MSVIVAFVSKKFAVIAADSNTVFGSVILTKVKKVHRLNSGALFGFSGTCEPKPRLLSILDDCNNPNDIPVERWPAGDYTIPLVYPNRKAYTIHEKKDILLNSNPCFLYSGTGGDIAQGAILAMLGKRKNLESLTRREVSRMLRRALSIVCSINYDCGGRISLTWL
jgi:ATP-dependent protease HslVU (ClpYQ) peptidase subunit